MSVGNTDPQIVLWLHAVFGGSLRRRLTTLGGNAKPYIWTWNVGSRAALAVCEMLLPFLRMKRPQAEILIRTCSDRRDYGKMTQPAPVEYYARLQEAWEALRALNRRGAAPDEHDDEAATPTC